MKKMFFILSIVGILVSAFAASGHCKTVVLFIGGWGMTPEEMEAFSRSVPESIKVKHFLPEARSELVRPWLCADRAYDYIKKNDLSDEDLLVVSYSLGGVVTQWLLKDHPELRVKKLILVASPIGGYKFVPPNNFFSNRFPEDLPIYVIAGKKGQDAWFLRDVNDEVVDLDSALDIPDQNLKDALILNATHTELVKMPEVQDQISKWLSLQQELDSSIIAENSATSSRSTNLSQVTSPYKNIHN